MNSFPYDSWEQGIEMAGAYFTWAEGPNFGGGPSLILAIIGIGISVISAILITSRENKVLNHAADRLADKYSSED